ncbi:hypothetical protein GGR50DRAFT_698666 [Xylaria sp. CBS 124048]|nr:hypothetical protein GGR50DRAFT_698666 [Xylaria sp. CBS 124048]
MPSATELALLARQLIRFHETAHPNVKHVTQADVAFAHTLLLAAPSSPTTLDLIPFPIQWAESTRSFNAFLRSWRRYPEYATATGPAAPTLQPTTTTEAAPGQPKEQLPGPSQESSPMTHPGHHARPNPVTPSATASNLAGNITSTPNAPRAPRSLSAPATHHVMMTSSATTDFRDNHNDTAQSVLSSPDETESRQNDLTPGALLHDFEEDDSPFLSSPLSSGPNRTITPTPVRLDQHLNTLRLQDLSLDTAPEPDQTQTQQQIATTPSFVQAASTSESHSDPADTNNPTDKPGFLKSFLQVMSNQAEQTFAADLIAAAFERQKSDISQIVAQTIKALQQERAPETPNGTTPTRTTLKSEEVGFYNPSIRDADGSGAVASGKQTVYTDVWAFTDRLTHLAAVHGDDKLKAVWTTCLQGTALSWHTTELTDLEKRALQGGDISLICETLQKRFKANHSDALHSLQRARFSLYDLAQGKPIRVFVQTIIRHAKACDFSVKNQLLAVFEAMDPEIQSQLTKPSDSSTIGSFLAQIDERESILLGKARQLYATNRTLPPAVPASQTVPQPAFYGKTDTPVSSSAAFAPASRFNANADKSVYQQRQPQWQRSSPNSWNSREQRPNNQNRQWRNNNPSNNYRPQYNPNTGPNPASNASSRTSWNQCPWDRGTGRGRLPHLPQPPPFRAHDPRLNDGQQGYWTQQPDDQDASAALLEFESMQAPDQIVPWDSYDSPGTEPYDSIMSCGPIPDDFGPPPTDEGDSQDAANFGTVSGHHQCQACHATFASNNKLHCHLASTGHDHTDAALLAVAVEDTQHAHSAESSNTRLQPLLQLPDVTRASVCWGLEL